MVITTKEINLFHKEIAETIESAGSTVIIRSYIQGKWRDKKVKMYFYNVSSTVTKAQNEYYINPGHTFEVGSNFIVSYKDLNYIPKSNDLILIPECNSNGMAFPLKIRDVFVLGEVDTILVNNILLFLVMAASRSEINLWSEDV